MKFVCCVVLLCWVVRAAEPEVVRPFDFVASDGATLGDVAQAAGEWFGVSIIVGPESAGQSVRGRVFGVTLEQTLSVIGQWSGQRHVELAKGVYFFGGKGTDQILSVPSYGFRREEIGEVIGGRGAIAVLGDRIVFRGRTVDADELSRALEPLVKRECVDLEIYALSVRSNEVRRVNAMLEEFAVGARYSSGDLVQGVEGLRESVRVAAFLRLLDDGLFGRLELRERMQLLSGSTSTFETGEVVEDELIIREPETGKDLVSQIQRRTVGLVVTVRGAALGEGKWLFNLDVKDGSFVGEREVRTSFLGERIVLPGQEVFTLAHFTRRSLAQRKQGVPLLKSLPLVGRAFRKSVTECESAELVLVGRVVR